MKPNSLHLSKFSNQILAENIDLMSFKTFCKLKKLFPNGLAHTLHNRMELQGKIYIHLLDVTHTFLPEVSVPSRFWVEAISTAVHLINRIPSSKLQHQTPYFRMHGIHSSYNHLYTFGCVCYVHLPFLERNKLTAQSAKCVFLGYAMNQKGFLCYDPSICRIHTSHNVVFF